MQLTTMPKTTKFVRPKPFFFRLNGVAHNISVGDTPHHVARGRLQLLREGMIALPD